jgi:cobalt/nickel transport system ATP-binding protein
VDGCRAQGYPEGRQGIGAAFAVLIMMMGFTEEVVSSRGSDCMKLLDIVHLAQRPPWHLSGGEKRKVAFASILALNPEVLVLDEPMNDLDPRTKRFLRALILSLHGAGKTIICATHDFRYVEGVFKRAVVFSEDHRIIREGPYDEVVSDEVLLASDNLL